MLGSRHQRRRRRGHYRKHRSTMLRIAADRERLLRFAQSSILPMSSTGNRSATSGSLPVAGRPRPLFLGITFIDFRAMAGLYLNYKPL